ncbi:methyltransferase domain-containing protein [Pseudobacter ginsenosidimutans]|uniref:Methyltransferase family protein n=1 Tax=Pseudobacter ginsenosidimutans TaxID=661488 RepID=A0A4Q7MV09_9BACT|nr:methyltransferase domain-containing protein [Pseudobacter ginsenosidimutans]QEC42224.1 methyltransferase domain-containing protein [Pseudobacter ginsenosidimutans]RZS70933.1 methyltransferase family protein [Pseudobacter ginsenosidimutans]
MQRSAEKELLDMPGIPQEDIRRNMEELDLINNWLGGHAITIAGLKKLVKQHKQLSICEIGCGGGDNLEAIARWCRRNGISVTLTGIDINPFCISTAMEKWKKDPSLASFAPINFITSDYKLVQAGERYDIIFSSLFCHHFTREELVAQLQWMHQRAGIGFFINDLHRHPIAYHSIKILTKLFSRSYLVKNDAPLSVKRSFVKSDWLLIMEEAGIDTFSVHWKWAFRWLVVVG